MGYRVQYRLAHLFLFVAVVAIGVKVYQLYHPAPKYYSLEELIVLHEESGYSVAYRPNVSGPYIWSAHWTLTGSSGEGIFSITSALNGVPQENTYPASRDLEYRILDLKTLDGNRTHLVFSRPDSFSVPSKAEDVFHSESQQPVSLDTE